MTPQQFVGLSIRLVAIWLIITGLSYLIAIPFALKETSYESAYTYFIAGAYLICAVFLWLFPMLVAHKLIPNTRFDNNISVQTSEIARVGCCLLGLWFFSNGLIDSVWFLFHANLLTSSAPALSVFTGLEKTDFALAIFKMIFSFLLILKSSEFARIATNSKSA